MNYNKQNLLRGNNNTQSTTTLKIEIALFCLLAFFVRLFLLDTNKLPFPDSMNYIMLGYNFIRGNFAEGVSFFYPMLFPIFVGLFSLIIKDHVLAGYITSIFFGSLLVIPTYLLARDISDRKVARLAALLLVFYPILIEWSNEPITDITYTFFFMSSVYFGWQALKTNKTGKYFAAGILFGLAYLTRSVGFILFLLMLFIIVFYYFRTRKVYFRNIVILVIGFGILAFSYIIFEKIYTHHWVVSISGKYNLVYNDKRNFMEGKKGLEMWEAGLYADKSSTLIDDFIFQTGRPARGLIFPHIDKVPFMKRTVRILKYIYQFYKVMMIKVFPAVVLILFSIGLGGAVASSLKISKSYLYLLTFMVLPVCQYFYTHLEERYFLTMLPIAIIFSGMGLLFLFKAIQHKMGKCIIMLIVFSLLILDIPAFRNKINCLKGIERPIFPQKAVGLWLRKEYPHRNLRLMDLDTRTALYARTNKLITLPAYCTTEEMIEYGKLKKVDFIIIGERSIIIHDRYEQKLLLNPNNAPEDLELVYQYDKDKAWGKFLVYKLKK